MVAVVIYHYYHENAESVRAPFENRLHDRQKGFHKHVICVGFELVLAMEVTALKGGYLLAVHADGTGFLQALPVGIAAAAGL